MLMRKQLAKQAAHDVCEYVKETVNVELNENDVAKIVDNNLGFLVDIVEENALEVNIQ